MVRLVLILLLFTSQIASANDITTFFDKLQGQWTLTSGSIINHDGQGHTETLKITKLTSKVEKTSDHEWKFSESYCVESDCIDTSYFYVLDNQNELYLVTEE